MIKTLTANGFRGMAMSAAGLWKWLIVLCALGLLMFFHYVDPVAHRVLPPCMFHLITGLHCPGCGAARAFHALAHGDIVAAAGYNVLLVFFLFAGFICFVTDQALVISGRRGLRSYRISTRASWIIVAVIILFGILRNIPLFPFTILAP